MPPAPRALPDDATEFQQAERHENPPDLHGKKLRGGGLVVDGQNRRDIGQPVQPFPAPAAEPADEDIQARDREHQQDGEDRQAGQDEGFWLVPRVVDQRVPPAVQKVKREMQRTVGKARYADQATMPVQRQPRLEFGEEHAQRGEGEHRRQQHARGRPHVPHHEGAGVGCRARIVAQQRPGRPEPGQDEKDPDDDFRPEEFFEKDQGSVRQRLQPRPLPKSKRTGVFRTPGAVSRTVDLSTAQKFFTRSKPL